MDSFVPTEADIEKSMPFMTLYMTAWHALSEEVKASYVKAFMEDYGKPYMETAGMIKTKELFAVADANSDGVLDSTELRVYYKSFMEHLSAKHGGVAELPEDK